MTAEEYKKISKEFLDEWKREDKGKHFIRDGIVNVDRWFEQKTKICFLLKEAYTEEDDFRLNEWLNNDEKSVINTWLSVSLWVDGILKTNENLIPEYHKSNKLNKKAKHNLLQKIAVINIKKSNGMPKSDWYDLVEYAIRDKDKLKKQLEFIKPDVIVCGNTYDFLRVIYGTEYDKKKKKLVKGTGAIPEDTTDKGYFITEDKTIVLKYYHPQNHFPSRLNFYTICCLYQQALKELNNTK